MMRPVVDIQDSSVTWIEWFCLNVFFISEINGFEKPHEERPVRSLVLFATILDCGEGNDRPMYKLGVRVNLQHIY
jgi:hypothetical protein